MKLSDILCLLCASSLILGFHTVSNELLNQGSKDWLIDTGEETEVIDIPKPQTAIIPIKNYQNSQFYGIIAVGNLKQYLSVSFDTIGKTLLLTSYNCKSIGCRNKQKYRSTDSKEWKKSGGDFKMFSQSVTMKGIVSKDTINLGGIKLKEQLFGEFSSVSLNFKTAQFDGFLGLGWNSSPKKISTILDVLMDKKMLKQPCFSFYLSSKTNGEGSALILGGTDRKYYTGELVYHKLVKEFSWGVKVEDVLIGKKSVKPAIPVSAIVQPCIGYIAGPSSIIKPITDVIGGESTIECSKIDTLPKLTIKIGEATYEIPPQNYILKITVFGKTECIVGFNTQTFAAGQETLLLGASFIKQYYSVFDIGQKRMGFAKAV